MAKHKETIIIKSLVCFCSNCEINCVSFKEKFVRVPNEQSFSMKFIIFSKVVFGAIRSLSHPPAPTDKQSFVSVIV
jgi:hypothetical protein